MAGDERTGSGVDDDAAERGQNPWVWTAIVVVVVLGAIGVSLMVGTDYRDPDVGDEDTTEFCTAVSSVSGGSEPSDPDDVQSRFADRFERLGAAAPSGIAPTLDSLEHASFALLDELQEIGDDPTDAQQQTRRMAAVDRFIDANEPALTRLETFIAKACGPAAPADPGTTATVGGSLPDDGSLGPTSLLGPVVPTTGGG